MRALTAESLLRAWEQGRDRHPIDRAVMLHALADPEADTDALADEPLGRRNVALLRLRQITFGRHLCGYVDCPHCDQRLEFTLDTETLLAASSEINPPVEVDGQRFRPPTSRDLAQIIHETDTNAAVLHLLQLCLVESKEPLEGAVPDPLIDRVEAALERADPLADIAVDMRCDACGHAWVAPFDIAGLLWEEIESRTHRMLNEVHLLARTYGWHEADILGMSEARRAAYLERVTA